MWHGSGWLFLLLEEEKNVMCVCVSFWSLHCILLYGNERVHVWLTVKWWLLPVPSRLHAMLCMTFYNLPTIGLSDSVCVWCVCEALFSCFLGQWGSVVMSEKPQSGSVSLGGWSVPSLSEATVKCVCVCSTLMSDDSGIGVWEREEGSVSLPTTCSMLHLSLSLSVSVGGRGNPVLLLLVTWHDYELLSRSPFCGLLTYTSYSVLWQSLLLLRAMT